MIGPFDFPMCFGEEFSQVFAVLYPVISAPVEELRVLSKEDQIAGRVVREFVDPDEFPEFVSCCNLADLANFDHLLFSRERPLARW